MPPISALRRSRARRSWQRDRSIGFVDLRASASTGRRAVSALVVASIALTALVPGDPIALAQSADARPRAFRDWRRVALPNADAPVTAVAADPRTRRLAVGDANGAFVRGVDDQPLMRPWRRHATSAAVTDLDFDEAGALWIATLDGLLRLDRDGRLEDRSPGPGDAARAVSRIASVAGLVVVGSEAGAYAGRDGSGWTRIVHGLPAGPVHALAMRVIGPHLDRDGTGVAVEIWLVTANHVWRGRAVVGADAVALDDFRRERISGSPADQSPVDVVLDAPDADVVVVYAQAIARRRPAQDDVPRWEVAYGTVPPGAIALRASSTHSGVWLGTDQGLLAADDFEGAWRREASPAGRRAAGRVVELGTTAFAVAAGGLLEGRPLDAALDVDAVAGVAAAGASGPAPRRPRIGELPVDPPLRDVHARALEYAGVAPDYFARLRRGLSRRGWLPVLSLRGVAGYDKDAFADSTESFTYGELHDLRDRGIGRSSDFEGSLTLAWDLGEIAYATDAPELSREARQVVTLRDNLLDEINQLYYDRRRALLALSAYLDRSDPEAVDLEIRCRELAAGLDAWTGGWFSSQIREAGQPAPRAPHR